MPHFYAKNPKEATYPFEKDGFVYEFVAQGRHDNLICVRFENTPFFLREIKISDKFLVKGDKNTRPPQAAVLQKALRNYAAARFETIESSNIEPKKTKEAKISERLKNIEFFYEGFEPSKEIWIEIGFGSGRHLLLQAKNNPNVELIGLEIHKPSISQVLRQIELQELENVCIVNYDARIFMEFLPAASVGRIFVHFPVPWDKKPQRRVISREFLIEASRVLKQGGNVEVRTDSREYADYCYEVFTSLDFAKVSIKKNADAEISSKYEDRWRKQNKDIYDLVFENIMGVQRANQVYELLFDKEVDFEKVAVKFENATLKEEGCFVHFEDIYKIIAPSEVAGLCEGRSGGLLKVSFGSSNRPEKKYILLKDKKAAYLPYSPVPSHLNSKAHDVICGYIYE